MTVLRHPVLIGAALLALVLALAGAPLHAQPSKGPPNALQGFSQNRDEPVHIDAATNKATPIPGLPAGFYWSIATTGDAAWTVAAVDSGSTLQLTRIDAVTHALTTSRIHGIALVAGDGQLWVQVIPPTGGSSLNYHSLIGQIDTATGQISRTVMISIGEEPGSAGNGYANPPFAVANGQIWSAYNGLQRTTPGAGGGTH